jgi:uncharacterized protein
VTLFPYTTLFRSCHLAVKEASAPSPELAPTRLIAGLVCLGYPLQSGATGAMRDEVLVALRTPVLFVQGTRDPLCPLDKLAAVRPRMTAPNHLFVVEGGDHSLEVSAQQRKAAGETQADSDVRVLAAIAGFIAAISSPARR